MRVYRIVESAVAFAYTGKIELDWEILEAVAQLAGEMEIDALEDVCLKFLNSR